MAGPVVKPWIVNQTIRADL